MIDGGSSAVDPLSLAFLAGLPLLRRRRKAALKLAAAVATVAAAVSCWRVRPGGRGRSLGLGLRRPLSRRRCQRDVAGEDLRFRVADIWILCGAARSKTSPSAARPTRAGCSTVLGPGGPLERHRRRRIRHPPRGFGRRKDVGDIEVSLDGWTAYGVGNWPVAQRWDLFGKAGWTWQNADIEFDVGGLSDGSASDGDKRQRVRRCLGCPLALCPPLGRDGRG